MKSAAEIARRCIDHFRGHFPNCVLKLSDSVQRRGAFPIRPVEDTVLENLLLEKLRIAIEKMNEDEQRLIDLRYSEDLSLEEIGKVFDLSKLAVSKRLKKTP